MTAANPFDQIIHNLSGAKANGHAGEQSEPSQNAAPIEPIRFADLKGKEPPPRRFIVEDYLPAGCVTSLYGDGGVGKSMLAQQVGTAVAVGSELFGHSVERGPVVGLMCEDDDDELWRRQVRINRCFAREMDQLENLHLQGRAGFENILAVYPSSGPPEVRPLLEAVRAKAADLRPVLIVLDPIAQLFGGNENDRFQVSHFVNLVGSLAREFACAVLLVGHRAKAEGSEYSGSTAWNASVRSRLLLDRKKDQEGELLLSRVKSNYAKPGSLELKWSDGVLRPTAAEFMSYGDRLDAERRAGAAQQAFLEALDLLTAQGISLSEAARASNYAPREIARHDLLGDFTVREMEQAMLALIGRGVIRANQPIGKGSNRHMRHGLARQQPGPAQEAA